jgi:hypothetical protein
LFKLYLSVIQWNIVQNGKENTMWIVLPLLIDSVGTSMAQKWKWIHHIATAQFAHPHSMLFQQTAGDLDEELKPRTQKSCSFGVQIWQISCRITNFATFSGIYNVLFKNNRRPNLMK